MYAKAHDIPVLLDMKASRNNSIDTVWVLYPGPPCVIPHPISNSLKASIGRNIMAIIMRGHIRGKVIWKNLNQPEALFTSAAS